MISSCGVLSDQFEVRGDDARVFAAHKCRLGVALEGRSKAIDCCCVSLRVAGSRAAVNFAFPHTVSFSPELGLLEQNPL